jgi:hypothetical protein
MNYLFSQKGTPSILFHEPSHLKYAAGLGFIDVFDFKANPRV